MHRRLVLLATCAGLAACAALPPTDARRDLVFFTQWSALLDQPAMQTVAQAASSAQAAPAAPVFVTGYADTDGSEQANDLLSALRARMVADQLVSDGVARSRVVLNGHGAVPAIGTKLESRRVGIVIGH